MAHKSMFDIIKKQNGERFAKTIRAYDNGIFDIPNINDILKYAGHEVEPLMEYLISLKNIKIEENDISQDPFILLNEAGYDAYYADTLKKQNAIQKYFEPKERLCTFYDKSRYQRYYIINAIKKNIDEIKRENFQNPEREDEYGTSVLSIQILKDGGFISIKNRYNHAVENPDNTYASNPDNIIKGLSAALKHHFNVDFSSQRAFLHENFNQMGNHIIKYNHEIDNIYFGTDFYAKDGQVYPLNKDYEIMLDYFVWDNKNKELKDILNEDPEFVRVINNETHAKKVRFAKNEKGNTILLADNVQLMEIKDGRMIPLHLPTTTEIGDNFFARQETLEKFTAPKLKKIGNYFLDGNTHIRKMHLPALKQVGDYFMQYNSKMNRFTAPKLEVIGNYFLEKNHEIGRLYLPSLIEIKNGFMRSNQMMKEFIAQQLTNIGDYFMSNNMNISKLDLPNVDVIGCGFLLKNTDLKDVNLPNLYMIGNDFLRFNISLKQIELPELLYIMSKAPHLYCLERNDCLKHFYAPKLEEKEYNKDITFLRYHPNRQQLLGNRGKRKITRWNGKPVVSKSKQKTKTT